MLKSHSAIKGVNGYPKVRIRTVFDFVYADFYLKNYPRILNRS